ncbi:MAG: hypothetical protein F6K42_15580, partial [Leptolyngbya sp. SIO1D8]|nr:hypothetical protein [Leptolyngbya sp. SIO1D8]
MRDRGSLSTENFVNTQAFERLKGWLKHSIGESSMPFNVALADLVTPYLVRGENLGANHAPLSAIRVTQFETASAAFGIVIRGRCEFNGKTNLDLAQGGLSLQVSADSLVDEGAPTFDPNRRAEIFDLRETSLDFELLVPRIGSNIIATGVDSINDDDFAPTREVLEVWEPLPDNPTPSDFPSSGFIFDLILNAPTVRPPFFQPAQMTPEGLLVPDDTYQEVSLTLPKLRFRFLHNNGQLNGQGSALQFQLLSAGVAGLDDPGDMRVAEVISMEPPYAFIGRSRDRTLGFAFRKAVLDLSNEVTPPAVIEKFGFGDDWGGLYLPEVRLFIAPEGARDFAFEAGVQDLLIGFGNHRGVSGDFDVALINQGDGVLQLGARFFDSEGNRYDIERIDDQDAVVRVPPQTRMVVDIQGGRAPYDCTVQIDGGEASGPARLFDINLGDSDTQEIDINVVDESFDTPISATLRIRAERLNEQISLPAPSDEYPPAAQPATLTVDAGDQPRIVVVMQNDREVWLTTEPIDPTLRWRVLNSDDPAESVESEATSIYAVQLAPGESKSIQARRPLAEVDDTTEHNFYFYFDEPEGDKPADEAALLGNYGFTDKNVWSTEATGPGRDRQPSGGNPLEVYVATFEELPSGSDLEIQGEASYENDSEKDIYNYLLARRRAVVVQRMIDETYPEKNFNITILPDPDTRENWISDWLLRDSTPQWWRAT